MQFANAAALAGAEPARVEGFGACRAALGGQELVSDPTSAGLATASTNNLLLMDGEFHQETRRVVASYFTRARLERAEQQLEVLCRECIDRVLSDGDIDLVTGLAEPLVLEGILSMMEVPDDYRRRLGELARDMLGMLEPDLPPAERRRATNAAMRATLLFERDGASGRATGLHAALEEAARNGVIPVKLARSTPVVVLHGGYENPLNQLGCIIAWAVENPDRFLGAAHSTPGLLFEEVLRTYSPVRLVARLVASDGIWSERPVRRGELVWVDIESANQDAQQYSDPRELELTKKRNHLGFGHGRHLCLGTALARLEGRVLIRSLLAIPKVVFQEFSTRWRDGVVARGPLTIVRRQGWPEQTRF